MMDPQIKRDLSMDVIRGFAVMGIFLMNVMGFGLPDKAYVNPAYYGGSTGSDLWVWMIQDGLFDGRMRSLFAMLFGAGLVMVYLRSDNHSGESAERLAWRHLWLALFGLAHIFLLQCRGDILWPYALCAMVCWVMVTLSPTRLVVIGLLIQALTTSYWLNQELSEFKRYQEGQQLAQKHSQQTLSENELKSLTEWKEEFDSKQTENWSTQAEEIIVAMREPGWRASFVAQQDKLLEAISITPGYVNLIGLMMLGMALGKWGFFTAERSSRCYLVVLLLGFTVIAPLSHRLSRLWITEKFSELPTLSGLWWVGTAATVQIVGALAWASLLILLIRRNWLSGVLKGLAGVGRMALSCYLLQTVIATLIFYSYGLAQFGAFSRTELAGVAVLMWLILGAFSVIWLKWFRFGPAEWLWRSLSYRRRQPMWRTASDQQFIIPTRSCRGRQNVSALAAYGTHDKRRSDCE